MKVLKITEPSEHDFVDKLLSSKSFNGIVFDNHYFALSIIIDSDIDFIYRRLYEDVYIKQDHRSYYNQDPTSNTIQMLISISEAIGYIYKATPPKLQSQIPDTIVSVEAIKGLLEQFLIDDNSGHQTMYHSYFKQYTKFEYFETNWVHDDFAINMVRESYDKENMICVLDAYDCTFDEIIKNQLSNITDNGSESHFIIHIQYTIHCIDMAQISYLINILNDAMGTKVVNIKYADEKMYMNIYSYIYSQSPKLLHEKIHKIITNTYEKLL